MPPSKTPRARRSFGRVDQLPSGRYRARYTGADGSRVAAPATFATRREADAWLSLRRTEQLQGRTWAGEGLAADKTPTPTFADYARGWLDHHPGLRTRTREHYETLLDRFLTPAFGEAPLSDLTPTKVSAWYGRTLVDRPTMRSHCYQLLRAILNGAVADEHLPANPCRIRNAGTVKRAHTIRPATAAEVTAAADAMPPQYRLLVLLAAWAAMRQGELVALRRSDVEPDGSVLRVRRGVTRTAAGLVEGPPKTAAGLRDVALPPHLHSEMLDHLARWAQPGRDGLLFPSATGGFLPSVTLYKYWYPAREEAGRPDLRLHDLRHSGAVLFAQAGATVAELQARLGHSSAGAALRYQHAAAGRDAIVAARMSDLLGT